MEVQWTLYTGVEDFSNRWDIVRVRMDPNVTEVRDRAFTNCTALQEVDLGNVTKIGDKSFSSCCSLVHLRLPRTVIEIGDLAFYNCFGMVAMDLGNVSKIGTGAFGRCTSLSHLTLPGTVIEIGRCAFARCEELVEVDLSYSKLLTIEEETFDGCFRLKSLTLTSTLVAIKTWAFRGCSALQKLELNNDLQKIGFGAFSYCNKLKSLTVLSTFMDIGERAFWSCELLRTVDFSFGRGVHHIQEAAFGRCTSLRTIKTPPNAFAIEWGDDPSCAVAEDMIIPCADRGVDVVERTVVAGNFGQSKHFLAEVDEKITGIISRQDLTKEKKLELVRKMIVYVKLSDATTCLELALLKAWTDKERYLATAPITRKRRRETRDSSRVVCGAEIIIPNVLKFLDGS